MSLASDYDTRTESAWKDKERFGGWSRTDDSHVYWAVLEIRVWLHVLHGRRILRACGIVILRASCPNKKKKKEKQTKLGTTCTRALEMEVGMRGCRFWWVPVFGRQYPYKDFAFSFQKFLFFELKIIVGTCLVLFLSYWQKEFFFKFSFFKSYFQFLWCLIVIAVEIFGI